ncbi:flavin reductase family protein [Frisingicoccus sp.]|uniref:flavin reductase family protein n=1 Tax=Frisingicoccus sp. TaxID=1918627 RepID=UPI0026234EEF|nr:flavin reductase family protein [Frisingicoccus sp.]MDD6231442.1 flavin reductase family protein [Frisingicoccus sp.]MDY4834508.1 flavin reductase family protein [Frisingicoccus sp.]MDY4921713.1 flavin reductase family protein [Frisingicoccus sp.]MDY5956188.1 flavin reductase family protein [Frisingicoccus sp.]
MSKQKWKPGNMLYPLPAVLVSCGDREGKINLMTAAWTGTVCSDPPMVYVSVRKERFSHHMIQETGEYVINLTTEELARATDFCGVRSGKDMDKFKEMHLTPAFGELQYAPMIVESPVSIECRVKNVMELGSHDMFVAEVTAVYVDERYMDENGTFHLEKAHPLVYSHGQYYGVGKHLGSFGYAVRKKNTKKNKNRK